MLRRAGLSSLVIRKTKNFYLSIEVFFGADDEARTRYLHLGKVALYQMSYIRIFCFCSLGTISII